MTDEQICEQMIKEYGEAPYSAVTGASVPATSKNKYIRKSKFKNQSKIHTKPPANKNRTFKQYFESAISLPQQNKKPQTFEWGFFHTITYITDRIRRN